MFITSANGRRVGGAVLLFSPLPARCGADCLGDDGTSGGSVQSGLYHKLFCCLPLWDTPLDWKFGMASCICVGTQGP